MKRQTKEAELDLELRILEEDQRLLDQERVKQQEAKRAKTNAFVSSNMQLAEMRKAQAERQVLYCEFSEG